MSVSQIITLFTLNLYSVICQWYLDKVGEKHEKNKCVCVCVCVCVYVCMYTYIYIYIWDSLKMPKFSFREFCQPKRAHLECYLIHWWEECVRQQRKVNCWYWRGGSWTLVEDLCLCLLVKLSVEDNSKKEENTYDLINTFSQ